MLSAFTLLLCLFPAMHGQFQTGGVTPIEQLPNIPYLQIKQVTLQSVVISGEVAFTNTTASYSTTVPLSRTIDNVDNHTLVTTDFKSLNSGPIGYTLKSLVWTSPTSSVQIQWTIEGSGKISQLKVTLVMTTNTIANYFQIIERTLTSTQPSQLFSVVNSSVLIPTVKSFVITYTGVLTGLAQPCGFKTTAGSAVDPTFYQVSIEKTPADGLFTLNVTFVVFWVNSQAYKLTAQFSNLIFTSLWDHHLLNSVSFVPTGFNSSHVEDMIINVPSLVNMSTDNPYFVSNLTLTGVSYEHNGIGGYFQYLIVNFKDWKCPATHPYKYKGDKLCYSCPNSQMVLINGDDTWSELNSTFENAKCIRLNLTLTGLMFDQNTGNVLKVCGYCRKCTSMYYLELGVCKLCSSGIQGCLQCSSNTTCTKCQDAYHFIDPDNNATTLNSICVRDDGTTTNITTTNITATNITTTNITTTNITATNTTNSEQTPGIGVPVGAGVGTSLFLILVIIVIVLKRKFCKTRVSSIDQPTPYDEQQNTTDQLKVDFHKRLVQRIHMNSFHQRTLFDRGLQMDMNFSLY